MAGWQARGLVVAFCPEIAGGMATPRAPAEITPGLSGADVLAGRAHVRTDSGQDVTAAFVRGGEAALAQARASRCAYALLTDKSPSCGSHLIHGGRFDGKLHPGAGVTTAMLRAHGIKVFSPDQIDRLAGLLRL